MNWTIIGCQLMSNCQPANSTLAIAPALSLSPSQLQFSLSKCVHYSLQWLASLPRFFWCVSAEPATSTSFTLIILKLAFTIVTTRIRSIWAHYHQCHFRLRDSLETASYVIPSKFCDEHFLFLWSCGLLSPGRAPVLKVFHGGVFTRPPAFPFVASS